MAIRKIVQLGDDVLRKRSFEVDKVNDRIITLLDDMKDTLIKADGAGLAAVQVGVLKRIFIVNVEDGYYEFINPVILSSSGSQLGAEGCLSVKGRYGEVERPSTVVIRALNREGKEFTLTAKDFFARAICHEYDHLDGILYIDKAIKMMEEKD